MSRWRVLLPRSAHWLRWRPPGSPPIPTGCFTDWAITRENSFSVDGQPITDQQSKVFSNQIPVDAVQSMEVIEGAPPAEYGDKTSLVIDVTTRSGQGVTIPHGSATAEYGSFGSVNGAFDLSYGGQKWGNFIAVSGLNSGRFLDGPEFVVMHDKGNEENFWDRADYQFSTADSVHMNLNFTRSWFQTPNSFDGQYGSAWNGAIVDNGGLGPDGKPVGPTDQRSQIRTFNIAPTWTHIISSFCCFYGRPFRASRPIQLLSRAGIPLRTSSRTCNRKPWASFASSPMPAPAPAFPT